MARRAGGVLVGSMAIIIIAILAFMPDPRVGSLHVMPEAWAIWLDNHYHIRHVIGYAALRLVLELVLAFWRTEALHWRALLRVNEIISGALILFAGVLELAQHLQPFRSPSWLDWLASSGGVLIGSALIIIGRLLKINSPNPAAPEPK